MEQLHFLAIAKANRENWLATMTSQEKEVMEDHLEFVRKKFVEGKIALAGPCMDGAYGIIIYKTESIEEAKQMYESDPLVKAGIMDTELHPFKVGLMERQ